MSSKSASLRHESPNNGIVSLLAELRTDSSPIPSSPQPRYAAPGPPAHVNQGNDFRPMLSQDDLVAIRHTLGGSTSLPSSSTTTLAPSAVRAETIAMPPQPGLNKTTHLNPTTSKNYRGALSIDRNVSADIPAHESCSAYLVGLPPTLGYYDLLGCLRYGKVVQTHIVPPNGRHRNSAAKVVFADRAGAEGLQAAVQDGTFGTLLGCYPRFMWNRIKVQAQNPNDPSSRVIRVTGPSRWVTELAICTFLWEHFYFDLEEITMIERGAGENTVEIRFGSLWFQSENAYHHLRSSHPERQSLTVDWSHDPCDAVDKPSMAQHGWIMEP
ncbi:hypothetical protein PGQ11_010787 [Apiospora arundinis]|uniref:RRM domain-containing protein n=1 Tax=Apiospora arundinis TaxID=335852 RepID=A0ABR2IBI7_9PEZI